MKIKRNERKLRQQKDFWDLWESKKRFLFGLSIAYTKNYHDAQDLLSEVKIKASGKINKKILDENPNGWLVKILKNTYINQYRHDHKRQIKVTYIEKEDLDYSLDNFISPTLLDEIYERELYACVESCLKRMPPRRRHITRLFLSGYKYREICNSYGLSLDAVRQMIKLSRNEISRKIESLHLETLVEEINEPSSSKNKRLYSHLIQYTEAGVTHSHFLVNFLPPGRLEQKAITLRKYISLHDHSSDRKLQLAFNLCSQGKLEEALIILETLRNTYYFCEDVFELQIKLLFILNRKEEAVKVAHQAIKNLSFNHCKFYAWCMLAQEHYTYAENFIKANIRSEIPEITLRLLLVRVYEFQGKAMEAYIESTKVYSLSNYNPDIFLFHLKNKLFFDGYKTARKFAEEQYNHDKMSAANCLYYLHFIVKENDLGTDKKSIALLNKVRKRYFWHPDFTLMKVFLNPEKTDKIIQRRCSDYPDCALSSHYYALLKDVKIDLPALSFQEKIHLHIVRMIYDL